MFDGTADQFHRLIASRAASSPSPPSSSPTPSSIPLHLPLTFTHLPSTAPPSTSNTMATTIFPGFDLYPTSHQPQHHLDIQQPIAQFLHPLHHHQLHPTPSHQSHDEEEEKVDEEELPTQFPMPDGEDRPWTDDEVLALFRTRSNMENWFPEVTWERVSRKLEELGFKRSPAKCKEKFEEGGSRFYDSINNDDDENNYGKNNFRILSELEEICQGDCSRNPCDPTIESNEDEIEDCPAVKEGENRDCTDKEGLRSKGRTKRNRQRRKFEMFKRFCEEVVEKLIVQQEEMQNKLLEDLVKRDEEMVAREEEWKKQEMDRINMELDVRASEQAIVGDRQAAVIELLKKFTSSITDDKILLFTGDPSEGTASQTLPSIPSNTCGASTSGRCATTEPSDLNPKSKDTENAAVSNTQIHQTAEDSASDRKPNFPGSHHKNPGSSSAAGATELNILETSNKRWPKDEVEALINLRCSIDNCKKQDPDHSNRRGGSHREAPLWERISQGMLELGYKRSAKRCKEKWENVNKYFRKTKDVRKKRSGESRTCPYFQQLSSLYGTGTATPSSPSPTNVADGVAEGDEGR